MGDTPALMLRSAAYLFVDIATPLADMVAFYRLVAGYSACGLLLLRPRRLQTTLLSLLGVRSQCRS